jgi:hypothetical protein
VVESLAVRSPSLDEHPPASNTSASSATRVRRAAPVIGHRTPPHPLRT